MVVVVGADAAGSEAGLASKILIVCCLELIRVKSIYFYLYSRV